jgi:hypothetical protein
LPAIFLKFSRSGSPRLEQMAPSYLKTDIYSLCVRIYSMEDFCF